MKYVIGFEADCSDIDNYFVGKRGGKFVFSTNKEDAKWYGYADTALAALHRYADFLKSDKTTETPHGKFFFVYGENGKMHGKSFVVDVPADQMFVVQVTSKNAPGRIEWVHEQGADGHSVDLFDMCKIYYSKEAAQKDADMHLAHHNKDHLMAQVVSWEQACMAHGDY